MGLVEVLTRRSAMPISLAHAGMSVTAPAIVVVPAGIGLKPNDSDAGLSFENAALGPQPADALLVAMSRQLGAGLITVVLTGRLNDGAIGARATKRAGGRVLVQDPTTAAAPGMPRAALATGCVDFVLPLERISTALITLTMAPGAAELLAVAAPSWAAYA
jgi:two-component system chemotaxis response regulator CheB